VRLGYVIQYVPDVAATVAFYEAAFGLERRFLHESGTYAEMETGATALAFASEASPEGSGVAFRRTRPDGEPPGTEIGPVTPEVEAAHERALGAGAAAVAPPKAKPWGQVVAYMRDLNGALVELCTPLE
jgi:lactoylglutathione lyase